MVIQTVADPIDINNPFISSVLALLLKDRTTGRNILWATDSDSHPADSEITTDHLHANIIKPRVQKTLEAKTDRTRTFAEVFTPSWTCNRINNHADENRFGIRNAFNTEQGNQWTTSNEKIEFPSNKSWMEYVCFRCLEITCGEAPFIASRYDTATGETIPVKNRIGLLDRKLRIVNENTDNEKDWMFWTVRAFQSVYGYEFQGDNLFIARTNLLMTFVEYMQNRWNRSPSEEELRTIADIIVWNIWQMDGFTETVPFGKPSQEQLFLFDEEVTEDTDCLIKLWGTDGRTVKYRNVRGRNRFFDLVVGNPPYQSEEKGNGRPSPIYDRFMDSAYRVANAAILITPARFLFNAGFTPKDWNEKMLNDDHFKVLDYYEDASVIFPGTDIKGGVAVSYRDQDRTFPPIITFTSRPELNGIIEKVCRHPGFVGLDRIVSPRGMYRLTEKFFAAAPYARERLGKNTGNMMVSNILERIPEMFSDQPTEKDDLTVNGRIDNERVVRYIKREYVIPNGFVDTYNIMIPKSNGTGRFGETLTMPVILEPGELATDTFMSIGMFESRVKAEAMLKYYCSRFFRTLLGTRKVTQDNPPAVWKMIPLLDFTDGGIDWSKKIDEIDRQLYKKYGLDEDEIEFVNNNVKGMEYSD